MGRFTKKFEVKNNNPAFIQHMEEQGWKLVSIEEGKPIMEYYISKKS